MYLSFCMLYAGIVPGPDGAIFAVISEFFSIMNEWCLCRGHCMQQQFCLSFSIRLSNVIAVCIVWRLKTVTHVHCTKLCSSFAAWMTLALLWYIVFYFVICFLFPVSYAWSWFIIHDIVSIYRLWCGVCDVHCLRELGSIFKRVNKITRVFFIAAKDLQLKFIVWNILYYFTIKMVTK